MGGFAFFDAFACSDKCAPWNTWALLVQLIACRGKDLQSLRKLAQPTRIKQFDLAEKAGFIPKSQKLSGSGPVHCSALVGLEKGHQTGQQRRQQGEGTGPLRLAFDQRGTCNRTKSGCRHTQPVVAANPCVFGVEMPLAGIQGIFFQSLSLSAKRRDLGLILLRCPGHHVLPHQFVLMLTLQPVAEPSAEPSPADRSHRKRCPSASA